MDVRYDSPTLEESVDVGAVAAKLWAGRRWVVASLLFFIIALTSLAFIMTPRYRATTVLISTAQEHSSLGNALGGAIGSLGGLASLAGISLAGGNQETEESLAVLRSQEFTEAFIQDQHLMQKLFAKRWDARTGNWKKSDKKPPTLAQAFKYFDSSVRTISQDKKTGLVTVQIDWKDRFEAADWANTLVQRLNEEMRTRAITNAEASLGFLEKELDTTNVVSTREAINRLIESQIKQRMVANVSREYAFRVVDKALAPDQDDTVRPKKFLMIAASPFVGAAVGVAGVLFMAWLASGIAALKHEAQLSREKPKPGSTEGRV